MRLFLLAVLAVMLAATPVYAQGYSGPKGVPSQGLNQAARDAHKGVKDGNGNAVRAGGVVAGAGIGAIVGGQAGRLFGLPGMIGGAIFGGVTGGYAGFVATDKKNGKDVDASGRTRGERAADAYNREQRGNK